MKIAVEGPQLTDVDFDRILNIFNRKINVLHFNLVTTTIAVLTVEIYFGSHMNP